MPIVNFYHTDATMEGTDYHDFIMWLPPDLSSTLPDYPYNVFCDHKSGTMIVGTVTSDGKHMIQQGNDVNKVPHMAQQLPIPPHLVKQTKNQLDINKNASSKAQMAVASVSAKAVPLACCIENAQGSNVNCSTLRRRSNTVKCVSSVRTRPTKMDYYIAFQADFMSDLEIWRFMRQSPGPSPPSKPIADRLKENWEKAKRDVDKIRKFIPSR